MTVIIPRAARDIRLTVIADTLVLIEAILRDR
jgi:hypothetical protein